MEIATLVLLVLALILLVILLRRTGITTGPDFSPVLSRLDALEKLQERTERSVKDEFSRNRQESEEQARGLRSEVQTSLKTSADSLVQSVDLISSAQQTRLEDFANQLTALKQTTENSATQLRTELSTALNLFKETQEKRLSENGIQLKQHFESFDRRITDLRTELSTTLNTFKEVQEKRLSDNSTQLQQHFDSFGRKLVEFSQSNQESAKQARTELSTALKDFRDSLQKQMSDAAGMQKQQLDSFALQLADLSEKIEKKFDELRVGVDGKLTQLQADNTAKLEEMRRTVDEKLQGTLEKRLGESFKQVSDRLEQVHKGLGEMQTLATGVGDLKRMLTNVKTRGTWGEIQLGNLLEQILTPEQYGRNVQTNPAGRETVEFAIKLPGRDDGDGSVVWLPLDAKFPKEDYERLVDASERGDVAGVEQATKELEIRVRSQAKDIHDKYISPPHTTDFGLLYLPTEGLYAEVVRRHGLLDTLQREYRVNVVGPTTLAALLNSLQMGFRTLAIQKQSSEVWKVLGAVKTEFGKFGDILDKVKKKIDETGNTIEEAAHRSRQLEKKLRKVEALPANQANVLLADGESPRLETKLIGEEDGE